MLHSLRVLLHGQRQVGSRFLHLACSVNSTEVDTSHHGVLPNASTKKCKVYKKHFMTAQGCRTGLYATLSFLAVKGQQIHSDKRSLQDKVDIIVSENLLLNQIFIPRGSRFVCICDESHHSALFDSKEPALAHTFCSSSYLSKNGTHRKP